MVDYERLGKMLNTAILKAKNVSYFTLILQYFAGYSRIKVLPHLKVDMWMEFFVTNKLHDITKLHVVSSLIMDACVTNREMREIIIRQLISKKYIDLVDECPHWYLIWDIFKKLLPYVGQRHVNDIEQVLEYAWAKKWYAYVAFLWGKCDSRTLQHITLPPPDLSNILCLKRILMYRLLERNDVRHDTPSVWLEKKKQETEESFMFKNTRVLKLVDLGIRAVERQLSIEHSIVQLPLTLQKRIISNNVSMNPFGVYTYRISMF